MPSRICEVVTDVARGEHVRLRDANGQEFTWPYGSPEPFQAGDRVVYSAVGAGGQYSRATITRLMQPGAEGRSRDTSTAVPHPPVNARVVKQPSRATKNCYVLHAADGTDHSVPLDEANDYYFARGDAAVLDVDRPHGERLRPIGEGRRHSRLPRTVGSYRGKTAIWSGYFWMSVHEALVEYAICKVENIGDEIRRIRTGGGAFGSPAAYTCHAILWRVGDSTVLDLTEEDGDVSVHATEQEALRALDEWLDANGGTVWGE